MFSFTSVQPGYTSAVQIELTGLYQLVSAGNFLPPMPGRFFDKSTEVTNAAPPRRRIHGEEPVVAKQVSALFFPAASVFTIPRVMRWSEETGRCRDNP